MVEIYFNYRTDIYCFLSNLYPARIRVASPLDPGGAVREYGSVEHFYQSSKFTEPAVVSRILSAQTPLLAMRIAHAIPKDMIRLDWGDAMDGVMLAGLEAKFGQNEVLRQQLLATGNAILHEDTRHPYWGYSGKDKLGKMLMSVREESRLRGM